MSKSNFNLNAAEFVPRFGQPPQQPPPQPRQTAPPSQQQQPQQHQQYQNPQFQNQFYQQQMHHQQQNFQQPRQHYQQQQQHYQQQQQQFQQQQQQQYQQQQQQQSPQKPAVANAAPPPQQQQQQPPAPTPAPAVSVSTSVPPASNIQQNVKTETAPAQDKSEPVVEKKPAAEAPKTSNVEELTDKLDQLQTQESQSDVADASEKEEWEGGNEGAGEGDAVEKKPTKKVIVREYKPKKEPVNVVFCGHVDAGKSTIGGQIMYLTGMVDKRTLEKYEREAKEMNRESWYLSWALDTNDEEREKGKTVEVGRAHFETEKKHFTILDAPGHRGFVPNMIGGAAQADIAVLVISARRGEFETGFERGGQTREHAMLVKTAGIKHLVVLVNKMDDPTVLWDKARYEEIQEKLIPYLKKCGFTSKDICFMPCSGFTGAFIKEVPEETVCPWYRGPCLIPYLDELPAMNRNIDSPLRMPLIDKFKDMGFTVVLGKVESGMIKMNDKLVLMPNKVKVEVQNIYSDEDEIDSAICGENIKLKLKGVDENEISSGFVLCDPKDLCGVAKVFDAQIVILECPNIISPGFNAIMHIHTATVEVQFKAIIGTVDKKSGEKDLKNRPRFIKQDQIAICRFDVLGGQVCCMEPFKTHAQLGRFILRYENRTVAVGKVLKIIE